MINQYPKRLIEVDLPIKRISAHARREKSIRHGHISTLHIWWARRPLAACRAVTCAALWIDPADPLCPQDFRDKAMRILLDFAKKASGDKALGEHCSEENWTKWSAIAKQEKTLDSKNENHLNILRFALLDFIADFANWDNSTVKEYLETSRALTQAAHEALGGEKGTRPLLFDPFAGGGAIPFEAARIGVETFASDINDIPVFINKVMLEQLSKADESIRSEYARWAEVIKKGVKSRLIELYPSLNIETHPFAYFWCRTIICEGPGCGKIVPLVGNPILTKKGDGVAISISYNGKVTTPIIKMTSTKDPAVRSTTKGGAALCECNFVTPVQSVRRQLSEKHGGTNDSILLCVGFLNKNGKKIYALPTEADITAIEQSKLLVLEYSKIEKDGLSIFPTEKIWGKAQMNIGLYGMNTWDQIFTNRQLIQLRCFQEELVKVFAEHQNELDPVIISLLVLTVNKLVDYSTSLCRWVPGGEFAAATIGGEKKLPMMWDFPEIVSHGDGPGSWSSMVGWVDRFIEHVIKSNLEVGTSTHADARFSVLPEDSVQMVFTDPPYYDAIWYSDLSDMFAVWLRRTLSMIGITSQTDIIGNKEAEIIKSTFAKQDNLSEKDDTYYENGMEAAFLSARKVLQPSGLGVVVFAHKSTVGWEKILSALINSGWIISSSWPIDTEREARMTSIGQSALASSIHLVCRPRENPDGSISETDIGDWRDVLQELPKRIHDWMPRLAHEGVVGADAIFACLGPALEIFSRYSHVEKASGEVVTLKEYLEYIWAVVAKEALDMVFAGAQTTDFEEDARLTAMWLWTLSARTEEAEKTPKIEDDSDDDELSSSKKTTGGFSLEFDTARKIAQGLGAHLEQLQNLLETKGDTARLLPVSERARYLFGKEAAESPKKKKKKPDQISLFAELGIEEDGNAGFDLHASGKIGETVLDRLHQSMILFATGRSEALKRFLVEDGVGQDQRFWRLAQAFSALYPSVSEEKRWVDGVLARKKGLGY